jgi:hypothetical protein
VTHHRSYLREGRAHRTQGRPCQRRLPCERCRHGSQATWPPYLPPECGMQESRAVCAEPLLRSANLAAAQRVAVAASQARGVACSRFTAARAAIQHRPPQGKRQRGSTALQATTQGILAL